MTLLVSVDPITFFLPLHSHRPNFLCLSLLWFFYYWKKYILIATTWMIICYTRWNINMNILWNDTRSSGNVNVCTLSERKMSLPIYGPLHLHFCDEGSQIPPNKHKLGSHLLVFVDFSWSAEDTVVWAMPSEIPESPVFEGVCMLRYFVICWT